METASFHNQEISDFSQLWGLPLIAAGCEVCNQAHLILQEDVGHICPNCARAKLNPQPVVLRPEPPELFLPFEKTNTEIQAALTKFPEKVWLKPDDFTPQNLISRLKPVFLPMWLVDCQVLGTWSCEAGFDYQVKSSQETYQSGNWHTEDLIKTRTRWEPRMGTIDRTFNNVGVPAISGYTKLINHLGKFNLGRAAHYQQAAISDAAIRVPDQSPENAWPVAKEYLQRLALQECQLAIDAQHLRNFSIQPRFTGANWSQLLLPVFFTYYLSDDNVPVPVFIHGQTGKIAGPKLSSWQKGRKRAGTLALLALGLFLLTLLFVLGTPVLPFLSIFAFIFGIGAFILGAAAIIPAVYPWQWNRQQESNWIESRFVKDE